MDVHFGHWSLHGEPRELRCAGRPVPLQEHPLRVLEALLEKPGRLVTRQELIARLWPRRIVDYDMALNTTMKRLRTVLGDDAGAPRYIETLPRKGYRFIGTVSAAPPIAARPPRRISGLATAAALALIGFFGLAASTQLRAVRPAAPSPAHFDADSARAQGLVLRAQYFLKRRAAGDLERAQKYFEEAIELQEDNALAWTGLASSSFLLTMEGKLDRQAGFEKLRMAAEKAIAHGSALAEPRVRLAQYYFWNGNPAAARALRREAAMLEPRSPLVMSQSIDEAHASGDLARAIELSQQGVDLDPLSLAARYNLGLLLIIAGRFDEALELHSTFREIHPGQTGYFGALALILTGRAEEALDEVFAWPADARRKQSLALIYHAMNLREEADSMLAELVLDVDRIDPFLIAEVHAFRGEFDRAFHWLEQGTEASRASEPARKVRPLRWARASPMLKPLHADPRWLDWLASTTPPGSKLAAIDRR